MSELIWRDEVVAQQELDLTNEFAGDVSLAIVPNNTGGDVVHDIANGVSLYQTANHYVWDSEGISPATVDNTLGSNLLKADAALTTNYIHNNVDKFNETSWVVVVDITVGTNGSNSNGRVCRITNSANVSNWNNEIHLNKDGLGISLEGNNVSHSVDAFDKTGRMVVVVALDHTTTTIRAYVNNVKVAEHANYDLGTGNGKLQIDRLLSLDNSLGTKLHSFSVVERHNQGFSLTEIESLASNPYQIFKTEEDARQEYGLDFENNAYLTVPFFARTPFLVKARFHLSATNISAIIFGSDNTSTLYRFFMNIVTDGTVKIHVSGASNGELISTNAAVVGWNEVEFYMAPTTNTPCTIILNGVTTTGNTGTMFNTEWDVNTNFRIGSYKGKGAEGFGSGLTIGDISIHTVNYSTLSITGNIGLYNFNTTQGYVFPDLYGSGNDATGVGFLANNGSLQPVIEKQVFDVGGGANDYANLTVAASTQAQDLVSANRALDFIVYGATSSSFADWRPYTTSVGNSVLVKAATGEEHDGKVGGTGASVTNTSIYPMVADSEHVVYRGFRYIMSGTVTGATFHDLNQTFDSMFIEANDNNNPWRYSTKDSVIYRAYPKDDFRFTNNIIIIPSGGWYQTNNWDICLHSTTDKAVGNLCYSEFSGNYGGGYNTTGGSYNINNRADVIGTNSLANQPINSWFTDPANNDYTINQTGQTALSGQGFNGSDIVGWAYAESGEGGLTSDVSATVNKPLVLSSVTTTLPTPTLDLDFISNKPTVLSSVTNVLPQPTTNLSIQVNKPVVTSSVNVTLPNPIGNVVTQANKPVVLSSGSVTLPQPNLGLSILAKKPAVVSSVNNTLPQSNLNVVIQASKPIVLSNLNVVLPYPNVDLLVTANKPVALSDVQVELPQNQINLNTLANKPTVNFTGSTTLPNPVSNIGVNNNKPTVLSDITVNYPTLITELFSTAKKPVVVSDIVVELPSPETVLNVFANKPTVTLGVSNTLPQPNLDLGVMVSKPTVSVVVVDGEFNIEVSSEGQFNLLTPSNEIVLEFTSNEFTKYTESNEYNL